MAERGLCSRREADRLIEQGLVLVNGESIDQLGVRVDPASSICLAPAAVLQRQALVTVLLNKPPGIVSNLPEQGYAEATSLIQQRTYAGNKNQAATPAPAASSLHVAGRLDIDSSGLLVLTQDGSIARELISPNSVIEKEYRVRVAGNITPKRIQQLRHGLELDGRLLCPATVNQSGPERLVFVLTEGRKRQIRRMCELVELKVLTLVRTRIGKVHLGRLARGQWRYLGPGETF